MPAGRPTKYESHFPEQAAKLCRLGATNVDLADFFDVAVSTISKWLDEIPEFSDAVKASKNMSDELVERRLFERATGYTHRQDKIMQYEGEPVIVPTEMHYAPETAAAIFWLKNRQPERWRDKQDISLTGDEALLAALDASRERARKA